MDGGKEDSALTRPLRANRASLFSSLEWTSASTLARLIYSTRMRGIRIKRPRDRWLRGIRGRTMGSPGARHRRLRRWMQRSSSFSVYLLPPPPSFRMLSIEKRKGGRVTLRYGMCDMMDGGEGRNGERVGGGRGIALTQNGQQVTPACFGQLPICWAGRGGNRLVGQNLKWISSKCSSPALCAPSELFIP